MTTYGNTGHVVIADHIMGNVTNNNQNLIVPEPVVPENVYFRVELPENHFTGRSAELQKLKELSASSDSEKIVLSGMGGVGKTQLARKFIVEDQGSQYNYKHVIWIDAERESGIVDAFKQLSRDILHISTINANGTDKDFKSVIEQVIAKLVPRKTLFIYDNIDSTQIMNFVLAMTPPPQGMKPHILITSRLGKWRSGIKVIKLSVWNRSESIEYISKILVDPQSDSKDDVALLAKMMQDFPLALRQATALINQQRELDDFKIAQYINRFTRNTPQLLESTIFQADSVSQYNSTTYKTWNVTIDAIQTDEMNGQLAIRIFNIIAYFEPDFIERKWFYCLSFSEIDQQPVEERVKRAVNVLVKYCMIDSQIKQETFNIHRLVQQVTKLKLKTLLAEEKILEDALQLFSRCHSWSHHWALRSNVISVLPFALQYPVLQKQSADLSVSILDFLNRPDDRQEFGIAVLKSLIECFEENDEIILRIRYHIASSYMQGYWGASSEGIGTAQQLFNKLLEDQKIRLGEEHPDTLQTMHDIAFTHKSQGDFHTALELFHLVLIKRKIRLGADHLKTIYTMLEIASTESKRQKYDLANEMYRMVYEKQKDCLGDYHRDTIETQFEIVVSFLFLGNDNEALKWFEDVIARCGKNPNNFKYLSNKAYRLRYISMELSIKMYQMIFEKAKDILGEVHFFTSETKYKIAERHSEMGKHSEALRLYREVYEKHKIILGYDHLDTLLSKHRIAREYRKQGQFSEALRLLLEIFEKREIVKGLHNFLIVRCAENIFEIVDEQKKLGQHSESDHLLYQRVSDELERYDTLSIFKYKRKCKCNFKEAKRKENDDK